MNHALKRQLLAEFIGTAFLLMVVVGSGIMAERLAHGIIGLALLANAVATGAGLYALIEMFAPISGAHFNPVVTFVSFLQGSLNRTAAIAYVAVQIIGAIAGVMSAHVMFNLPLISLSEHIRSGEAQWWSEFIATFGLLAVILSTSRHHPKITSVAVSTYITAAYWFTASTSFANPAVTLARSLTNTFAGIRPEDVGGFILMQVLGMLAAFFVFRFINNNKVAAN